MQSSLSRQFTQFNIDDLNFFNVSRSFAATLTEK